MSKPKITPLPNGPLLVDGLENFRNSKGPIEPRSKLALCRCGASANKPYCDGAHSAKDFSSDKLETRTEDRVDDYAGKDITVHDNRGLCAHAGVCTKELPAVWRMKEKPWIDPDGAPADEVAKVVEGCPSGALAYTRGGRAGGDVEREAAILVSKDGPLVVTGGIELSGETMGQGASAEHYTLCRCGDSKNKPFCDGTHWSAAFRDEDN